MDNNTYDVYGIGNALVDLEFEVSDEFFAQHDVDKGQMTLVDMERQRYLMQAIREKETKRQAGGSAANSIMAISQFGGRAFYSCKVANDDFGQFFLEDLTSAGIDSNLRPEALHSGDTGRCLVMVTPDAERTMNTFLGITSDLSTNEIDEEALSNSRYIYIEGYLVASPSGLDAMKHAKSLAEKHGVKTSITFSDPSMAKFFSEGIKEVIGDGVDLLFCNEEEAMTYTETSSVSEAREALKQSAKNFVITQGRNGAMIFDGTTFIDIEPYPVEAIDTNGAGDMFAGAYLYGITHGHSAAQAGKIASLASSKVVTQFGPRLDWSQAKEILNHLFE